MNKAEKAAKSKRDAKNTRTRERRETKKAPIREEHPPMAMTPESGAYEKMWAEMEFHERLQRRAQNSGDAHWIQCVSEIAMSLARACATHGRAVIVIL